MLGLITYALGTPGLSMKHFVTDLVAAWALGTGVLSKGLRLGQGQGWVWVEQRLGQQTECLRG